MDEPCPKCGRVHDPTKCKAHSKRTGQQCGREPTPGHDVCATHGSKSPQAQTRAHEVEVSKRVAAYLSSHNIDLPERTHPIDGLMQEVQRSAAAVAFYGMLVAELEVPNADRTVVLEPESVNVNSADLDNLVGIDNEGRMLIRMPPGAIYGRDHKGDGAPHVLITLWNQERDRHARLCKMALDAGVAERMVRMTEEVGRMIVEVINGTLADPTVGLSAEQQTKARTVAAGRLALLPAPPSIAS